MYQQRSSITINHCQSMDNQRLPSFQHLSDHNPLSTGFDVPFTHWTCSAVSPIRLVTPLPWQQPNPGSRWNALLPLGDRHAHNVALVNMKQTPTWKLNHFLSPPWGITVMLDDTRKTNLWLDWVCQSLLVKLSLFGLEVQVQLGSQVVRDWNKIAQEHSTTSLATGNTNAMYMHS